MEKELIELLKKFNIFGDFHSIEIVSNGHINSTFLVRFINNGKIEEYILQKINKAVFSKPEDVMHNISIVTEYINSKSKVNDKKQSQQTLHFYQADNGKLFSVDKFGDYWRLSDYVENSTTFNETSNLKIIEETGVAFGEFHQLLADFPAEDLNIIISDFHNTLNRYAIFKETLQRDPLGRSLGVAEEISEYLNLENIATQMYHMLLNGELLLRVTHNDTKCNNVLFDKTTHKHLCVIDLDTVMPGLLGFDFGDAIRFIGNSSKEDETALSNVWLDLKKFEAFTKGFLSIAGSSLTENEKNTLALACITMTTECGLRFLTDYIDGDNYFKINHPNHNLDRARCQLKLAKSMIEHLPEMNAIINQNFSALQKGEEN